jgi:acyl-CoA synthetase (NDP forming)
MSTQQMSTRSLAPLFSPRSLAVVGASENPRKWGNWLARGALRGERRRTVHLVNRRGGEILGRRALPSLGDLPGPVELAVIALPDEALYGAVQEALSAGAKAIVAISAANDYAAGMAAQRDRALAERVRAAGAVLLGPNCLGVQDAGQELELTSNPLPPGAIGLVSQSGNLALELGMLAGEAGLGFSRFASLGNQADLDATDLIRDLAAHDATELIALYVEDFRDGRAFARAAVEAVAAGKPVLLLAIESGPVTGRAVQSHTGALASGGAAIDAACRAAGIDRVSTPHELIDTAQALLRARRSGGRRVAVLSDGGGHGAIAAAASLRAGLEVPRLGEETSAQLRALLGARAAVANPVDLAGAAERDVHSFDQAASALLSSGEIDAVLLTGYLGGYAQYGEDLGREELQTAGRLGAASAQTGRPLVTHTMFADAPAAAVLREGGVPVYPSIEQAVSALARLAVRGARRPAGVPVLPEPGPDAGASDEQSVGIAADRAAREALAGGGYEAARALLAGGGVSFVEQRTVTDLAGALRAARDIGYPVVLKALGVVHKSDAGGVAIGLRDDAAVEGALGEMRARLAPVTWSVERMAPLAHGVELLIGSVWDPRFGPVALAGSGGVYAEILRDTAVALAPVGEQQAEEMLRALRCAPLLTGARGREPLALGAAARALAALSVVAAAHPELSEIEINPLLVTRDGAVGLDARLVRRGPTDISAPGGQKYRSAPLRVQPGGVDP